MKKTNIIQIINISTILLKHALRTKMLNKL